MKFEDKNIVLISTYASDVELCMGGSLSRIMRQGRPRSVVHVVLSLSDPGEGFTKGSVYRENLKAWNKVRDMHTSKVLVGHWSPYFKPGEFQDKKGSVSRHLMRVKEEESPDIVFAPSVSTHSKDRAVVGYESSIVFEESDIFGYEGCCWNRSFYPDLYLSLHRQDLDNKIDLCDIYKSQREDKVCFKHSLISTGVASWGMRFDCRFAEAFETIR